MGAAASNHPADPILQAYGLGKLDDVSCTSVSKHLQGCDACQRRVAELSSDEFLGRLQKAQVNPDKATSGWSPSVSSTEGAARPVAPPPPVDTLPPELVDHADYEIVRELGRGGMGVVYLAQNKLMGRQEVLKVVGRHLIERPGVVDRFLREIRAAAKLHHANIVAAHSAIRLGESLVLAMEYVEGLDLAKMVINLREQNPVFDTMLDKAPATAPLESIRHRRRAWSAGIAKMSRLGTRGVLVAIGMSVLGSVFATVLVIKLSTPNGLIVLENVPANAVVEVDGERITVTPAAGEPVTIEAQPGKHGVVVKRADVVLLADSGVTVESGKQLKLTIRRESPPAPVEKKSNAAQTPAAEVGTVDARRNAAPTACGQAPPAVARGTAISSAPLQVPTPGPDISPPVTMHNTGENVQAGGRVGSALDAVTERNPWPKSAQPDGQNLPISGRILCMSSDCRLLAIQVQKSEKQYSLRIVEAPEGVDKEVGKSSDPYRSADFSPDGKRLAVGHSRGVIWVWDTATGQEVRQLKGNQAGIPAVKYSPDGQRIASAGWDSWVRLWEASTGELQGSLPGRSEEVRGVAFNPDGALLAIGHEEEGLELWNPASSRHLRFRSDVKARIRDVTFSPDGRYIASASGDKIAQIWDVQALRSVSVFDKHPSTVNFVRFSPDGRLVASVGDEEVVRVWEAATGREVHSLKGIVGHPNFVQFSPRGHWIYAGSEWVLKSWEVPPATGRIEVRSPTPPQGQTAKSSTNPRVALDRKPAAKPDAKKPAAPRGHALGRPARQTAQVESGSWRVVANELIQTDTTPDRGRRLFFGDLNWTDYDFTVELLRENERGCNSLINRRTLRSDDRLNFAISCDEDCLVNAFEDGDERELKGVIFHQVSGRWYRARVSVRGNRIACTLHDDQGVELVNLEATDKDNRHPIGQVGLGTENSAYRFRNIKVTSPDKKILWEGPPDRLTDVGGKVIWTAQ